jgi:outer membrane immunogenic protein
MKKFLTVLAFSALVVSPVMAADMAPRPAPPVYKAPPPIVPIWSWTGCYFGGHFGGVWSTKDWTDATPGDLTFGQSFGSHNVNGWLGGIQGGCDYQFAGGFVIGIQADYAWTNANARSVDLLSPTFGIHTRIDSLGSGTVRLGYAWGQFLGYVKGGAAWEWDNHSFFDNITLATVGESGLQRRIGWTVGVGGEYAFTNYLSAFVEYDYYGFGTRDITFNDGTIVGIQDRKSVVKAGLNFRWGPWWGTGPVAARY